MIVYFITFILVVLLCAVVEIRRNNDITSNSIYIKEKKANYGFYYFLVGCTLIIVAGFRYSVGTDYFSYYNNYSNYIAGLDESIRNLDEPGFGILAWIATRFINDGASVIFLASLVTISLCLIVIYRNTDRLLLTTVLYITLGCWHGSFNGVRQYLAASIVFCGLRYLKNRQFIKYCLVVFVAFLFHRSALIMLPVFFLTYRTVNIKNLIIDIISILATLSIFEYLFTVAGWIMEKNYSMDDIYAATEVNRIRVISSCIPAFVFLIVYLGKELTELETLYLNITILHAAFCVSTMNSALLYRIGIYTAPFQVLAIPQLLKGLSDNYRKLITAGLLIMYIGMWWYELFTYSSYNNFQWIWQR